MISPEIEASMVQNMLQTLVSESDRKAIAKLRGFGSVELESLALFANTFCSSIGLNRAFAEVDEREKAFLHLLALQAEEVHVDFFKNLYSVSAESRYASYTQRYSDVLKQLRQGLIRKGLLLWAELGKEDTKLERYRFALPRAVEQNLGTLLTQTQAIKQADGGVKDGFREQLIEVIRAKKYSEIGINAGNLMLKGQEFGVATLEQWQDEQWLRTLQNMKQKPNLRAVYYEHEPIGSISPAVLIRYGLGQIAADQWIKPEAFKTIFDLAYPESNWPALDSIFERGWEWGCLERIQVAGTSYYRLNTIPNWTETKIKYLHATGQAVQIDVKTVPYVALSQLMRFGDLAIQGKELQLGVNLTKLSLTSPAERANPLAQWLKTNSAAFAAAFQTLEEQWGKILLHENLLYAQVNDLSLHVILKKAFNDGSVVFLPQGWLAFPASMLRKIETLVNRSGHVIKELRADD